MDSPSGKIHLNKPFFLNDAFDLRVYHSSRIVTATTTWSQWLREHIYRIIFTIIHDVLRPRCLHLKIYFICGKQDNWNLRHVSSPHFVHRPSMTGQRCRLAFVLFLSLFLGNATRIPLWSGGDLIKLCVLQLTCYITSVSLVWLKTMVLWKDQAIRNI